MQNPFESLQQFSEQMNWVSQMFGPESMAQMREMMQSIKEPGRPRNSTPVAPATANAGPPLEIYLTPQTLVLSAVLSGLSSPEQVRLSLLGPKELLLEAFLAPPGPTGAMLHQERFTGYCHRIVILPVAIVVEGATASCTNGILECRFQRLEQSGDNTGVAVLQVHQP